MSNPNANVRKFDGAVNAAAYWIYDHLLRAGDIVNDSTVTGTTVKAALNTLSAASSAVFPFVAAGLAEQDLVSYDAGAATWRNRTKVAALKGTGADSFVVGTSSLAAGTNDIILGPSAGNVSNTGSNNIGIGLDTLDDVTVALTGLIAIGNAALSGPMTALTDNTIAIGTNALTVLTSGQNNIAIGRESQRTNQTGGNNTTIGSRTLYQAASNVGSCTAIGTSALQGALTSTANGAIAIGSSCLNALTSGAHAVGVGVVAGGSITTGSRNIMVGFSTDSAAGADDNTFMGDAVGNSSVGSRNTAVGSNAFNSASAAVTDCVALGYNALTGVISSTGPSGSVAIGSTALQAVTTGAVNTAVGFAAGLLITIANSTSLFGYSSGSRLTTGGNNSFFGALSGRAVIDGTANCAFGSLALGNSNPATTIDTMVAIGTQALSGVLTSAASGGVGVGNSALSSLTSGANATAVGFQAGATITTGSNMTFLGYGADGNAAARSGCVVLGTLANATANDTLVIRMGNTSAKELVVTPVVTTNVTLAIGTGTYMPITVGGVAYKIQLYS